MLAVMLLSQHQVSSSKTVRPHAPCGAQCIGHAVKTWSAVCSEAPHLQFGEGARPHLCMDTWNHPTPVCRWLNLTQSENLKLNQYHKTPNIFYITHIRTYCTYKQGEGLVTYIKTTSVSHNLIH